MFANIFFVGGITLGLIIAVIILKICNTNKKVKTEYDERQEAIRGRSYKWAMYTAWGLMLLLMTLELSEVQIPVERAVVYFTVMIISAVVQITYSIWNDSYFGTNNDFRKYVIAFIIITLINAACAIMVTINGRMVVNGVLSFNFVNAECALLFIILGIQLFIKNRLDRKESEEE